MTSRQRQARTPRRALWRRTDVTAGLDASVLGQRRMQSATTIAEKGCRWVISGHMSPEALSVLYGSRHPSRHRSKRQGLRCPQSIRGRQAAGRRRPRRTFSLVNSRLRKQHMNSAGCRGRDQSADGPPTLRGACCDRASCALREGSSPQECTVAGSTWTWQRNAYHAKRS